MLQNTCLLVSLRITMPPQTKTAKAASEDVEQKYRTARRQGRVTKNLFPEKDIKPLVRIMTRARSLFNEISLPYDDSYRIIPTDTYFSFVEKMSAEAREFDTVKQEFLRSYPDIKHRALYALGDLYNPADYPEVDRLADMISFSIESSVVPAVTAFDDLAGISPDEIEKLKAQAVEGQQDRVQNALKDLFQRLFDSLDKARVKLSVEDAVFRDSLVGNIHAALEAIDSLNFDNNQELNDLAAEVRMMIDGIRPQDLRDDKELRQQKAEETQAVIDKMNEFL